MIEKNKLPMPIGRLEVELTDKITGEVVDGLIENNIIVNHAKEAIIRCISDGVQDVYAVRKIQFGEDIGSGTAFDPEPPTAIYDESNMDSLYTTTGVEFFYPTTTSVQFNVTIDGNVIVDAHNTKHGTSVDTADVNSTALLTGAEKPFSYKRFPVKVVTRFVNVNVRWTLEY